MEKLYTEKEIPQKCILNAMQSVTFISNSSSGLYIIWKKLDLSIFLLLNSFFEYEIYIHFLEKPCFMFSILG